MLQRGMASSVSYVSPTRSTVAFPTAKRIPRLRKAQQTGDHSCASLQSNLATASDPTSSLVAPYIQKRTSSNCTFSEVRGINTGSPFKQSPSSQDLSNQVHLEEGARRGLVGFLHGYHGLTGSVEPSPAISATFSDDTDASSSDALLTPPPLNLGDILEPEFADELTAVSMLPLDEQHLTKKEREEAYLFYSYATGPSTGVQESVGSYKSFMNSQVKHYFGNLKDRQQGAPPPVVADLLRVPEPAATCSLFGERTPVAGGEEDFKKWLMPPRRRIQKVEEKLKTPEPFDLLSIMSASSPPPEDFSKPLMEYPNVSTQRAPTSYTSPKDFTTYPNADFHIRGVPIIAHNKSKIQLGLPSAADVPLTTRQPFTSQVSTNPMPQPSLFAGQQFMLPPPIVGLPCESYALPHAGHAPSLPGDENFPPMACAQQFLLCGPDQMYLPVYLTDQGTLQQQIPLYAPAPSLPEASWLGWEQERTEHATRLRGFSASGDL
jgi:hypothetical protein